MTFSAVCELSRVAVLLDGVVADDVAGTRIGDALKSACSPPPTVRSVPPQDGGAVSSSGEPLVDRGEALVCGGGSFFQAHVGWLERSGALAIIDSSEPATAILRRRDGGIVVSEPFAHFDGGFDYFVLEMVRGTPASPLSVYAAGFYAEGTAAAGWYFQQALAPAHESFAGAWYVVKWTDQSGDGQPGAGDGYEIIATGG